MRSLLHLLSLAFAVAFLASGGTAAAESGEGEEVWAWVIYPVQMDALQALILPHEIRDAQPGEWAVTTISVQRSTAEFGVVAADGARCSLTLHHPTTIANPALSSRNFAMVRSQGAGCDTVLAPLADAITSNDTGEFWRSDRPDPVPTSEAVRAGDGGESAPRASGAAAERPGSVWLPLGGLLLLLIWRFRVWRARDAAGPKWRRRAGSAVALLLATLALAELLLHLGGVTPPEPALSPDVDDESVDNRLNSLGMREAWNELPMKEPGEIRVGFLGDSFTFGQGVERDEAFPALVARRLSATYPDHSIRVFNLGIMGDDTAEEAARYRGLHDQLELDVLVLVAYLNDFTSENPAFTIGEVYGLDFEPGFAARNSLLAATIGRTIRNRTVRARSIEHYNSSTLADLESGEFDEFGGEIAALRDFAVEGRVEFKLAFFPWLFELDDYHLRPVHQNLARFAEGEGIEFLDLLAVYDGQDHEEMRVSAANEHPSVIAHQMAAEAFADFLRPTIERLTSSP